MILLPISLTILLNQQRTPGNQTAYRKLATIKAHYDRLAGCLFSKNGEFLLTVGDGPVKVWNPKTGKKIKGLNVHSEVSTCLDLAKDNDSVAVGTWDNTIEIWSLKSNKRIKILNKLGGRVRKIQFSNDGTKLLAVVGESSLRVWELKTLRLIVNEEHENDEIKSALFLGDSTEYAVVTEKRNGIQIKKFGNRESLEILKELKIESVLVFNTTGNEMIVFDDMNQAHFVDCKIQQEKLKVNLEGVPTAACVIDRSKLFVYGTKNINLYFQNMDGSVNFLKMEKDVVNGSYPIVSIAYNNTNKYIAIGQSDGTVYVAQASSLRSTEIGKTRN